MITPRYSLLVLVVPLLGGCPNPNTYTSARTLRGGDFQLLAAAEGYAGIDVDDTTGETTTEVMPALPTVGLRYGISDSTEIGLRAPNLLSVAVDTKVQLRRGTLDIALDPGVQWFSVEGSIEAEGSGESDPFAIHAFDVDVPIMFGWNFDRKASLVFSPGVVFRSTVGDSDGVDHQWFGLASLGVNLRATRTLAIHPQVATFWDLTGRDGAVITAGLGFTFGGQPTFDDLATQPTEAPVVARQ